MDAEKVKQEDKHVQRDLDTSLKTSSILDFFQVVFYIWNYYQENVSVLFLLPSPLPWPWGEGDWKSKDPGNWNMIIGNHFFSPFAIQAINGKTGFMML